MDLFLDILCARNKQRVANFNHTEEAMSRVPASAMFFFFGDMTTDFRGNGYSKNRLIAGDCVGEPTHAITTTLSNSLVVNVI